MLFDDWFCCNIDHTTNEGCKFAEDAVAGCLYFCNLFTWMEELAQKTR
jgi:hypothetical protein